MKIVHWIKGTGSGAQRVPESLVIAEQCLGLSSILIDVNIEADYYKSEGATFHVAHTHVPECVLYDKKAKLIIFPHGTPETVFTGAVNEAKRGYGHGDGFMLNQFWLQHSDAIVTFWPRHEAIWRSMCDKHKPIFCIPMGVDQKVWKPQDSRGKFTGTPSVFTSENSYQIKWPYDLFIAWPWVIQDEKLHGARLHCIYLPTDQHRWFFPLVNRNGASFASYISAGAFKQAELINALCSTDFYCGLVRYGDHNHMCMQAKATGAKVISYRGNPYADYWITEGDQRVMAEELKAILRGEAEPRIATPVSDISETAKAMKGVYESL